MTIKINSDGWGDAPKNSYDNIPYYEFLRGFGLDYVKFHHYKVIDEKLFFLSVIKYGIVYVEIKC